MPVCGSCFQLVGMEGELSPGNEHPNSQAQLCHELTKAGTALLPQAHPGLALLMNSWSYKNANTVELEPGLSTALLRKQHRPER